MRNDRTLLHRLIWLRGMGVIGGASGAVVTVDGVSPLSLPNAKAGLLRSLIQRGKCTVESGALKCNNGVIGLHDDELPDGYRRLLSMSMNNNCYYVVPDFHLTGADTLRFSYEIDNACNVIGSYSGSASGANYSLYTNSDNYKYLRYYSGQYSSKSIKGKRYDVAITPTGAAGMEIDSTWEEIDFVCPNDFFIGTTSTTTSAASFRGTLFGNVEVEGPNGLRFKGIPCERVSDGEIGWYDTVSETFFEPVGTTPTVGGYDYSHIVRTVTGTPEVITATSGDTAGAVDLLAVGSVADTQDIISGEVTRRTEAILYDGTQDVGRPYLSSTGALDVGAIVVHAPGTEYSGAVATFDAEAATPINAAIVSLEPTQDLHGYDKPWAGGAGKNVCPSDGWAVGQYNNGTWEAYSTRQTSPYIAITPGAAYTMSIDQQQTQDIAWINYNYFDASKNWLGNRSTNSDSEITGNRTKTFTISDTSAAYIRLTVMRASDRFADIDDVDISLCTPQLELGDTATSYAPYSNECPIAGWTEATLTKAVKNLLDVQDMAEYTNGGVTFSCVDSKVLASGTTTAGANRTAIPSSRAINLPAGTYTFSMVGTCVNCVIQLRRVTGSPASVDWINSTRTQTTVTLTEATACYINVNCATVGVEVNADCYIQLERGSTATDWEPYVAPTDYPETFPVSAGTVYGGTLDIVNGTLTVDRVMRTGTDWRAFSKGANGFYGRIYLDGSYLRRSSTDIHKCRGNLIPVVSGSVYDWHANTAGTIGSATQYLHMYVPFGALPEYHEGDNIVTLFNAKYDATAFRFILPIEPVVYQLTPQQIDTIAGGNVFYSDAGAVSIWVQDAPTTESAAPQALRLTAGSNTLTVTAEVSGIELAAKYMEG